ncbi:hypothetical protein AX15_001696 [Amanita polypyramis BW_CC]|nr:hypothetical protein AX15_001696 [Amanita polypyramis BW_CC]
MLYRFYRLQQDSSAFPIRSLVPGMLTCFFLPKTNLYDPFSNEACVAAASCYPGNPNVFLAGLSCFHTGRTDSNLTTLNIPRVSNAVYNKIANGGSITYTSYYNWFTRLAIAADLGVEKLIDLALVKLNWDSILAWTGFCSSGTIPKQNFLDWFQYSSTVSGPGTSCGDPIDECSLSDFPYQMDLLNPCSNIQNAISNPFSISVCVAAALNWDTGIDSFLQALTCRYNSKFGTNHSTPASTSLPALSVNIAQSSPYTQQNFIDFTYGALSSIQASVRYPTYISWVVRHWEDITEWTGFCGTSVPKKNLSDFLLYSHLRVVMRCPGTCGQDSNPGCERLFELCTERSFFGNPWHERTCVLAATCYTGGVKGFATDYSCVEDTFGADAQPVHFPRLAQDVWNTLDNSATGLTGLQNYINDVTNALGNGTVVPSTDYLTNKWNIISNWTAIPSGNIPLRNFADWLQYS